MSCGTDCKCKEDVSLYGKCDFCGEQKQNVFRQMLVENETDIMRMFFICTECKVDILESSLLNMFETEVHMNTYLMDMYDRVLCDKMMERRFEAMGDITPQKSDVIVEVCKTNPVNTTTIDPQEG